MTTEVAAPTREAQENMLEAQADDLLWNADIPPRYLEYNFYREAALGRARRREEQCAEMAPPEGGIDGDSVAAMLEMLIAGADLASRHHRVLSLMRRGLTFRQMARAMGVQPSTAFRWYLQAIRRLQAYSRRLSRKESERDILAAFSEQAQVEVYRTEGHCRPGREACAKDGLCKRRWYLYVEGAVE